MSKTALALASFATVISAAFGASAIARDTPTPATDPAGQEEAPACLRSKRIVGWSRLDDHAVVLRTQSKKFKVTFVGPCRQSNRAYSVNVRNFGVCVRPGDTAVFTPAFGMDPTCVIDTVTLLPKDWTPPPKPDAPR